MVKKFFITLFFLLLCLLIVVFTPVGKYVIKSFIGDYLNKIVPGVKIIRLDYGLNSFSLTLKKDVNKINVYGEIYPFNAMVEGNIEKISSFLPALRGKMSVNGKLTKEDKIWKFDGACAFAGGILNVDATYLKKLYLRGEGNGFDIKRLLYMVKKDYPIRGETSLKIEKSGVWVINSISNGVYNKKIKFKFNADSTFYIKKVLEKFSIDANTSIGTFFVKGNENKMDFLVKNLKLKVLRDFLMYPLVGEMNFKGMYDARNNILKFTNKEVEGYKQNSQININFKMPGLEMLGYLDLETLLNGTVTGNVSVNDKKGYFDLIITSPVFKRNYYIDEIYRLTGVNLYKKIGTIFAKGTFDEKELYFNLLSKNDNMTLSIQNGKVFYNKTFDVKLLLKDRNVLYVLNITKNNVRLIKKKIYEKEDNKILVF